MAKRPEKPVSLGRRSFFRQLLASALTEAEKAGKEFARTRLAITSVLQPESASASPAPEATAHRYPEVDAAVFGPPWPAPAGPPVPLWLQKKLRQPRLDRPGTVSRSTRLHDIGPGDASPI